MNKHSAGLLMYKIKNNKLYCFLGKCGGPHWENVEISWGIPKGKVEKGEAFLFTAMREFKEETGIDPSPPYIHLPIVQNKIKQVHIWAFELDHDLTLQPLVSNICHFEWPKKSGTIIEIPELCEGRYFTLEEAKPLMFTYQYSLLFVLNQYLHFTLVLK